MHHEAIRLAAERNGASWRRIKLYDAPAAASSEQMVEQLHHAISPRTRVVGLTWVHSSTGVKLPVRAMSHVVADVNRSRDEHDRVLLFAPRGTGIIWAPEKNWGLLRPTIPSFYSPEPFAAWEDERPSKAPTRASWISPGGFKAYEHQWCHGGRLRIPQPHRTQAHRGSCRVSQRAL